MTEVGFLTRPQVMINAFFLFTLGLADSLSIHKFIAHLTKYDILKSFLKCFAINGLLLLGSSFLYGTMVHPLLEGIYQLSDDMTSMKSSDAIFTSMSKFVWVMYHSLWCFPIWGLCYILSSSLYQDIASSMFSAVKGFEHAGASSNQGNLNIKITQSIYAFLVWFFVLIEIKLLTYFIPITIEASKVLFLKALTAIGFNQVFITILFSSAADLLAIFVFLKGCIFMSILYGWYGFDYYWLFEGRDADARFRLVERYWPYFLGFGIPYSTLVLCTSFFVGYGTYLILFPISIVLSAISDYTGAVSPMSNDFKKDATVPTIHLFALPKKITAAIITLAHLKFKSKISKM